MTQACRKNDRAVLIRDVFRQAEAVLATIQKLGQQRASRVPALRAQIAAVQLQHIEHAGSCAPHSWPVRENTRTRSPSRWQMKRKPSCLIS